MTNPGLKTRTFSIKRSRHEFHLQSRAIFAHERSTPLSSMRMWILLSGLVVVLFSFSHSAIAAPTMDWQDRLIDKEYRAELYNALQNYLNVGNDVPRIIASKRNSEIINSLLALPKNMAEVGR